MGVARGWNAGEIQWPIPLKLQDPGDIQIYGYDNEVLLDSRDHASQERRRFDGEIIGGSELARLREDLHSGRRRLDVVAPKRGG